MLTLAWSRLLSPLKPKPLSSSPRRKPATGGSVNGAKLACALCRARRSKISFCTIASCFCSRPVSRIESSLGTPGGTLAAAEAIELTPLVPTLTGELRTLAASACDDTSASANASRTIVRVTIGPPPLKGERYSFANLVARRRRRVARRCEEQSTTGTISFVRRTEIGDDDAVLSLRVRRV